MWWKVAGSLAGQDLEVPLLLPIPLPLGRGARKAGRGPDVEALPSPEKFGKEISSPGTPAERGDKRGI